MRRPFTCPHPEEKMILRRRLTAAGTVMLGHQCDVCGSLAGKWVKLERVPQWRALPEWDLDLESRWVASEKTYMLEYREERVRQDGVVAFAKPIEPTKPDFWAPYSEYLQSPAWRDRRALVLARAAGKCEGCAVADATQVHHLTYERVGKEMLFDLVAICDTCHAALHEAHR